MGLVPRGERRAVLEFPLELKHVFASVSRRWILLVAVVALAWFADGYIGARVASAPMRVIDGVAANVVFGPSDAGSLGPVLGPDFDVRPDGMIVLQAADRLVALRRARDGSSSSATLASVSDLHSFTGDGSGAILASTDRGVEAIARGNTTTLITLPDGARGVRLARAVQDRAAYLFGGDSSASGFANRVVMLTASGSVDDVARLPRAVVGVADAGDRLFIATAREVFELEQNVARLVIRFPAKATITSIATPPGGRVVYVATSDRVYAVKGTEGVSIATGIGGSLRMNGSALFVLDPARRTLMRLDNLASL